MPVVFKVEPPPGDHRTSLRVLAKALTAVQGLAFDLGKAIVALEPAFHGRTEADIQAESELVLEDVRYSSMELTLSAAPLKQPELWDNLRRVPLGPEVEDRLNNFFKALGFRDGVALRSVVPDPVRLARVTRRFASALPPQSSGYTLKYGRTREPLSVLRVPAPPELDRLLPGIEVSPERSDPNRALIEGTCLVLIGKDGRPSQVEEWIDYAILSQGETEPYVTDQILWKDRLFVLQRAIECPTSVEDHLFVVQYEPLMIRAYAPTREQALRDFAEEFAFRWDDYALAADEELTWSAVDLKRCLRQLVKEVRTVET